jgi:hypothetical protein
MIILDPDPIPYFHMFLIRAKVIFEPASLTQDCTAVGLNEVSMCSTIMNPDESMNMSKINETVNSTAVG